MPNTLAERLRTAGPRPLGVRAALAALCLSLAGSQLVTGCSSDATPPPGSGGEPGEVGGLPVVTAPDVVRGLARLLERRAAAVLSGERRAFLAGVAPAVREEQAVVFDNLAQLPTATYALGLDRRTLVRDRGEYRAEVEVTLQLGGYDRAPVTTRDRYTFAAGPSGRLRVLSSTDPAWARDHGRPAQPWDRGPVTVVEGRRALVVLDEGSAGRARRLVREADDAAAAVMGEVPGGWDGRVVVHALADPAFLADLEGVPGGDAVALDAVTVPMPAGPDGEGVAAYRVVLNPRIVASPGPARNRLLRHELVHVALGERQDGLPTWFAEGLAEYVSVRPLPPERRAVSAAALDAAEAGLTGLPDDETFNDADSRLHYAVAWWACEYLAATYDESTLWLLLDTLDEGDPAEVLEDLLDLDEATLARRAGRLMVATYRPRQPREPSEPSPSESTGEPSATPSDAPSGSPSSEESESPWDVLPG